MHGIHSKVLRGWIDSVVGFPHSYVKSTLATGRDAMVAMATPGLIGAPRSPR